MADDLSVRPGEALMFWPGFRADTIKPRYGRALTGVVTMPKGGQGTPGVFVEKDDGGTDFIALTNIERVPKIEPTVSVKRSDLAMIIEALDERGSRRNIQLADTLRAYLGEA